MGGRINVDPEVTRTMLIAEIRNTFGVSGYVATNLADRYESVDAIRDATHDELREINGIGEKWAARLSDREPDGSHYWSPRPGMLQPVFHGADGKLYHPEHARRLGIEPMSGGDDE